MPAFSNRSGTTVMSSHGHRSMIQSDSIVSMSACCSRPNTVRVSDGDITGNDCIRSVGSVQYPPLMLSSPASSGCSLLRNRFDDAATIQKGWTKGGPYALEKKRSPSVKCCAYDQ